MAADVDRTRKLYKTLHKQRTIVECWGLRGAGRDARSEAGGATAELMVRQAVAEAGQQIEPAAARLVAERAGTDIARLRGDVERLMLYAAGQPKITLTTRKKSSAPRRRRTTGRSPTRSSAATPREALRQLALALDAGGVSVKILGQLGWFVREKMLRPTRGGSRPRSRRCSARTSS